MDTESLRRIDRLLRAYPTAWDDDPGLLDELLGVAAEREAGGEPVAQSNPELAVYLALHPGEAESYAELVWLAAQPLDELPGRAATSQLLVRLRPSPTSVPERPSLAELLGRLVPLRLGTSYRSTEGQPQEREPVFVREHESLWVTLHPRASDERGSLYLRVEAEAGQPLDLSAASAELYPLDEQGALLASGPSTASALFDPDFADLTFDNLDPTQGYGLLVRFADRAPLLLILDRADWPTP